MLEDKCEHDKVYHLTTSKHFIERKWYDPRIRVKKIKVGLCFECNKKVEIDRKFFKKYYLDKEYKIIKYSELCDLYYKINK